jgi:hypothetical protein
VLGSVKSVRHYLKILCLKTLSASAEVTVIRSIALNLNVRYKKVMR